MHANLTMTAKQGMSELRAPVHLLSRPDQNANATVLDTPIVRRSTTPYSSIWGHNPRVDLFMPDKADFRWLQYHYFRNPGVPAAAIAEFIMTAKKDGIQLQKGDNGFSVQMGTCWELASLITKYAIVRAEAARTRAVRRWPKRAPAARHAQARRLLLPAGTGEGFFVLNGDSVDVVVNCVPSKKNPTSR